MNFLNGLWGGIVDLFRRLFAKKSERAFEDKNLLEPVAQHEEQKEAIQTPQDVQKANTKKRQDHQSHREENQKALDVEAPPQEDIPLQEDVSKKERNQVHERRKESESDATSIEVQRLPIDEEALEKARQKVEVLVRGLMSLDPLEVAQWEPQLRPREEDWEKAFLPHVIPALRAYFGPIFNDDPVPKPKPGQTEVRISVAQAEHFWDSNPVSDTFSGGMGYIAHLLQPGSIWIDWRYVRPGRKWGKKYNGLVYFPDEGRFAWFPFPFEALKEYYRVLPDDD